MNGVCHIVAGGDFSPSLSSVKKDKEDIIIAADKGYQYLQDVNITPDITVGDFDSLNVKPKGEIIQHPVRKDDTDTMLAVKTAFDKGYKNFKIYCATGGRLDHTIANIGVLSYIADRGGRGVILSDNEKITVIKNSKVSFTEKASGVISVFPVCGDARGVNIKGLSYTLENAKLTFTTPLGVSNEFCGKPSEISVANGFLAIIWSDNTEDIIIG